MTPATEVTTAHLLTVQTATFGPDRLSAPVPKLDIMDGNGQKRWNFMYSKGRDP
jgi:hypothetical protein